MRYVSAILFCSAAVAASSTAAAQGQEVITVVVTGDVGLNRNQLPVDPRGVLEGKKPLLWSDMSRGIDALIDGDINFMNLETVVTDRNDLKPGNKRQKSPYLFRTHPKGVEHLINHTGFNLISGANNHTYDYGEGGVRESIKHLRRLEAGGKMHWAGIGLNRAEASRPVVFKNSGATVAFSAIGIVTNMIKNHRATPSKPGSMGYRYAEDWKHVVDQLGKAPANLKLLSVHYGRERKIASEKKQLSEYRFAARERGVDIVIGHHAHVVRGIELHRGKVLFYGLGNFMIRGARDMRSVPKLAVWGDYGLLGKVYLKRVGTGYQVRAIEVVPLIGMHRKPRRFPDKAESMERIEVLNVLAERLDDKTAGSVGVRFMARKDGTGLYCVAGAKNDPAPIANLCKSYRGPTKPSAKVRQIVSAKLPRR